MAGAECLQPGAAETTILVVEDDLGLVELIREEFEQRGWGCAHCATGAAAIAWLGRRQPTLALLDYSLPDMTGAELISQVPIDHFIVTTGAGDERVAVDMMKRGALDYLVKDGLFLGTLPGVVELALHHIATERRLAMAEADLKLAEADLVRARRMESLGLMAGGIAHDFNNLFQSLQANLEIAVLKAAADGVRAPLERALKILDKAALLTHRMLEFSGKGLRRSAAVNLNALVEAALQSLSGLGDSRIRFTAGSGLPSIEGDAVQLTQVVTGLVLNARESLGAGGAVRIVTGLDRSGDPDPGVWIQRPPSGAATVCLTITDTGSGMTREVLERAFDPFFTTRHPGRGLGLSAALGILRTHHAGLWVATAPGQGTTLRIHFPPGPDSADGAEPGARADTLPERRTILVVDDDPDLQETIAEYLGDVLGYPVLRARDGVEAVETYRRERDSIGVVLMDATMPRMTGPAAFRAILDFAPEAKAILCSGFSEEAGSRVAVDAGFLGHLKKPFTLRELQESLDAALGDYPD